MKAIKKISKVIGTLMAVVGVVLATAETDSANMQVLWTVSMMAVVVIGYKLMMFSGEFEEE